MKKKRLFSKILGEWIIYSVCSPADHVIGFLRENSPTQWRWSGSGSASRSVSRIRSEHQLDQEESVSVRCSRSIRENFTFFAFSLFPSQSGSLCERLRFLFILLRFMQIINSSPITKFSCLCSDSKNFIFYAMDLRPNVLILATVLQFLFVMRTHRYSHK